MAPQTPSLGPLPRQAGAIVNHVANLAARLTMRCLSYTHR